MVLVGIDAKREATEVEKLIEWIGKVYEAVCFALRN